MSWDPITEPIDHIVLGGTTSPGIAEVVGANSPRKWDELGGFGLIGATLRFRGTGLARFSVKLRLYDEDDWAGWELWKEIIMRPPIGKRPRSLDIYHPFLADFGIKSAVVEDVLQPEQTDHGEWTIEIKFIESRFPKVALSKPEASQATPVDPVEQEIGALTDQLQSLAAQ